MQCALTILQVRLKLPQSGLKVSGRLGSFQLCLDGFIALLDVPDGCNMERKAYDEEM